MVEKKPKGRNIPHKVLRYFTLKGWLCHLFTSRHTAQHMKWHLTGKSNEDGLMWHPVDREEWKDFDKRFSTFALELRNVRLGLAADRFNPFGNMSASYSM